MSIFKLDVLINKERAFEKEIDIYEFQHAVTQLKLSSDLSRLRMIANKISFQIKNTILSEFDSGFLTFNERAKEQSKIRFQSTSYDEIDNEIGLRLHLPYYKELVVANKNLAGLKDIAAHFTSSVEYNISLPSELMESEETIILDLFFGTAIFDALKKRAYEPLIIKTKISIKNTLMAMSIPCTTEVSIDSEKDAVNFKSYVSQDFIENNGNIEEATENRTEKSNVLDNEAVFADKLKEIEKSLSQKVAVIVAEDVSNKIYKLMLGTEDKDLYQRHSTELIGLVKHAIVKNINIEDGIKDIIKGENSERAAKKYVSELKKYLNK